LGGLLTELVAGWPVPAEELVLVGHSMGGLVVRSACHYGASDGQPWVPLVRHAVYLGTPHLGAPLARAAGLTGWALSRLPETRPFAPLLNGSSDGVKDLRFGYLADADWWGCDPDRCRRDHRTDVPLLESANHYAFGVTVTRDPNSPVGTLVGDLLVQPGSAHGQRRRRQHIAFPVDGRRRVGGLHHLDLLGHPAVWAEIRRCSGQRPPRHRPPRRLGELLGW
jgi:pimeloyl-ACP methyl ester carboxylesterase